MNIHQPKIAKAFKFALGKLELKRAVYVFETPSEVINNKDIDPKGILITYGNNNQTINISYACLDPRHYDPKRKIYNLIMELMQSQLFLDKVNDAIGYRMIKSLSTNLSAGCIGYELNHETIEISEKIINNIINEINKFDDI